MTVLGAVDVADSTAVVVVAAADASSSAADDDDDDDEYYLKMMNCIRSFVTLRPERSSPSGKRCRSYDVRSRILFGFWRAEA